MAKLIEITGKALSGEWGTEDETGDGIPVLRTTNFTNEGVINYQNIVTRSIRKKNIADKYLRYGDIIIEKSGGSDKQPVGRVIFFDGPENTYLFNNFTGLLRVQNQECWLPKYVFYSLFENYRRGGTRPFENKTTGLHNLKIDDFVSRFEVTEVGYKKQVDICEQLDRLYYVIKLREEELSRLDELIKARFVELFESENDVYEEIQLEEIADIVSGITKGRKTKSTHLRKVPYMAVSNVKDGYIDWTTVKTILATEDEIEQYRLVPDDVLMTEGGDPDKVGRGSIITEPPIDCIHQNHIFRVRLDENQILPRFFSAFLQSPKAKTYFLRAAKQTTGIASINMKQLRGLPTIVPPMDKQLEYVRISEQIDKSKLLLSRVAFFS
ncbi:restriction endonuclease subunit S [Mobilibacterium timonense]|uniref:restriction endonuclease subunit S n=1 Tax=Mobilibacterium timonense TaxID=1871012 RepID=UPI0009852D26|nr:restriction endonuclease subunit S [Mobilibacterium timonense]